MKRIYFLILLFIMFIPVIVNAETCDVDKITITSITVNNKSDNVVEFAEPGVEGRKIGFIVKMSDLEDNIEYKIVVKNDSNEDYELNKNSLKIDSEYFDYSVSSSDNSFIVKANSSKEINLRVTYSKPIPADAFNNGFFENEEQLSLNLSTGNNTKENIPNNPNTGVRVFLIIFTMILFLIVFTLLIINKKKYIKYLVLIGLLVIPTSVYAICRCDITVYSYILVSEPKEPLIPNARFCYTYEGEEHYFDFVEGMTWEDYIDSPLNKNYIQYSAYDEAQPTGYENLDYCNVLKTINGVDYGAHRNALIQSSEVGCYIFTMDGFCK